MPQDASTGEWQRSQTGGADRVGEWTERRVHMWWEGGSVEVARDGTDTRRWVVRQDILHALRNVALWSAHRQGACLKAEIHVAAGQGMHSGGS